MRDVFKRALFPRTLVSLLSIFVNVDQFDGKFTDSLVDRHIFNVAAAEITTATIIYEPFFLDGIKNRVALTEFPHKKSLLGSVSIDANHLYISIIDRPIDLEYYITTDENGKYYWAAGVAMYKVVNTDEINSPINISKLKNTGFPRIAWVSFKYHWDYGKFPTYIPTKLLYVCAENDDKWITDIDKSISSCKIFYFPKQFDQSPPSRARP